MRAFGPGSISSFLKTVLDLLYALLWMAAALLFAAAAGAALAQPFLVGGAAAETQASSEVESLLRRGPALALAFGAGALNLAGLIMIAQRLRCVFATMTAGDPFEPRNVGRLQTIGTVLLLLQPAGFALSLTLARLWPERGRGGLGLDVSAWFAVLIVFVLAEVFREGARLRTETRLTV